jgi:hypothetical protein
MAGYSVVLVLTSAGGEETGYAGYPVLVSSVGLEAELVAAG